MDFILVLLGLIVGRTIYEFLKGEKMRKAIWRWRFMRFMGMSLWDSLQAFLFGKQIFHIKKEK